MFFSTLIRNWLSLGQRRPAPSPQATRMRDSFRPRVEWLEDRRLLSISTSTTLDIRPDELHYGEPVGLVAHVSSESTGSRGSGPTGTVQFYDTASEGATPTLLGTADVSRRGGTARLTTEALAVGTHSLTAVYVPADANAYTTSTSTAVTETVDTAETRTLISASSRPGVAGTDVTFTALVTSEHDHWWGHGWHGDWSNDTSQAAAPTGTVSFTVDGGTAVDGTYVGTSDGKALYTFTPDTPLAVGTHTVVATYSGDTNYAGSTSREFSEQIVAATAGSVTAGSAASPLTLRGGDRTFSVNVTQDPASTPIATGTVTYVDAERGINLTSTEITSVAFSSNGRRAEISGKATNTDGTTSTPVTFTMIVDQGHGGRWSKAGVSVSIVGPDIAYHSLGRLGSDQSITVDGTGTTGIPALGSYHDRALDAVLGDWRGFGFFGRHHGRDR
jgi:hypothetical protein